MSEAILQSGDVPQGRSSSVLTTHPVLGIIGVLLGAMIATCTGRLISVGLEDLRGALHLGVDEASWLGTAFNSAQMFIGPFSVYLGGLLGARRVLIACGGIFTVTSFLLPFAVHLPLLILLLLLAGLTAGTFYPLTLSFVMRNLPNQYIPLGIAAYAIDILFTTNMAISLEAWYVEHLSWHWIYWNSAVLTPLMIVLIYFGVPRQPMPHAKEGQPEPNWRGFLYISLGFALIYAALDQGQRLDWLHSGTIVAFVVSGGFLLACGIVRHFRLPNPLVNLKFLRRRNTALLSLVLIFFRFVLLAAVIAIPSYLSSIQGYRALQTGPVLLWLAIPQALLGLLAIYLLRFIDARLILAAGFTLIGIACVINAHLSSAWSGENFRYSQWIMASGLALAFNGLVGALLLEILNTEALSRPIDVLTFSGFFQTVRLFGGQLGVAFMQHLLSAREQFHSNILGLGIRLGDPITDQRLAGMSVGLSNKSADLSDAAGKAVALLGLEVRKQAFTLAISDSFFFVAWASLCALIVVACMARVITQYRDVVRSTEQAA